MKKMLILLIAGAILLSGCTGPKTAKIGDNISVDYTGRLEDGKVFDTTIESVGIENNLNKSEYKPLNMTLGKTRLIKGFEEGIVGMKEGQSKTLNIPPDKAYGPYEPGLVQASPIIINESINTTIPKIFEISLSQFEGTFGKGHKVGESINYPKTNINVTVLNMSNMVSLSYDLTEGFKIVSEGAPWNETVTKIDDKNITLRHDVALNSTIQLPGVPWNSTVIN
ncbi:MAG TPA: FKBP-type peptidyl-prolyl cis-trans isomerase, partial [Candidatus Methanoperedens sp.]